MTDFWALAASAAAKKAETAAAAAKETAAAAAKEAAAAAAKEAGEPSPLLSSSERTISRWFST